MRLRLYIHYFFIIASLLTAFRVPAQFVQQGGKLVGTGSMASPQQGAAVAISANGNTAIMGGLVDNNYTGAAWIFARVNGMWVQQGNKLVGTGAIGNAEQGTSVAISADGNTAIIGGPTDDRHTYGAGAAWVFTRSNGIWVQQGNKLVGTDTIGDAGLGSSVAISADGNTVVVGGSDDNNGAGATWVFTRSNGVWTQQGNKLSVPVSENAVSQGASVAIAGEGNTVIITGDIQSGIEKAWAFTRSNGVWTQQGNRMNVGYGSQVALSNDGNTAIFGSIYDNNSKGSALIFVRTNSTWAQQGNKLVGDPANGGNGYSVSISGDGNTVVVGQPYTNKRDSLDGFGNTIQIDTGAAWVFTRTNSVWTQQGIELTGSGMSGYRAFQGESVAISADAKTIISGGPADNDNIGACWIFVRSTPPLEACPSTNLNITSNLSGNNYQWKVSTNNGSIYSNIINGTNYIGASSATLQIINAPSSFNGYIYLCVVDATNSDTSTLHIVNKWTGASNANWSNPANWSCGSIPDTNTNVIINNGTVVVDINAFCNSLHITPGVNFTVNPGVQITVTH